MRHQYVVFEQMYASGELGEYNAFGITLLVNNEIIETIADISCDKTFVETLVNQFNENQVSSIHFKEIVLDSICR